MEWLSTSASALRGLVHFFLRNDLPGMRRSLDILRQRRVGEDIRAHWAAAGSRAQVEYSALRRPRWPEYTALPRRTTSGAVLATH